MDITSFVLLVAAIACTIIGWALLHWLAGIPLLLALCLSVTILITVYVAVLLIAWIVLRMRR